MNDNFDKEFNNLDNEQESIEQNTSQAEKINFTKEPNESEEFALDEFEAQKINIPETVPAKENTTNKGIKIFCLILAAVIVLSCSTYGGYFIGKNSNRVPDTVGKAPSVSLQSKPENANAFSAAAIYSDISKSVVGIFVYNEAGEMSEASGVVYSEDGYIITNDHIYSSISSAKFKIFMSDGSEYDAYYVAGDTRSDLAVLKISENIKLPVPVFGNSDEVITGEAVCAVGYPNGYSAKSTITSGIVSVPKVRMSITTTYSSNFIQTDTAINPGNSGGALVNMYGQIVGITSSKISGTSYEGVGFAIPTKTVQKVVQSLIENGNVKNRARLGISYNFYNSAMAELSELPACGLLVREVSKDSDLFGKLNEGDMITRVNDIAINDDAIILDLLEESEPGSTILLTVIKQSGETATVSAVLLNDEGSSSYVNSEGSVNGGQQSNGGDFNWPEGF